MVSVWQVAVVDESPVTKAMTVFMLLLLGEIEPVVRFKDSLVQLAQGMESRTGAALHGLDDKFISSIAEGRVFWK